MRGGHGARRRLFAALIVAVACGVLFVLALRQSFTSPLTSDGAANVLQARAILHGNPLLRGWWTSDVSFYTTELPEYALVTAFRGLTPDVVHICGALSYTLTVLLAALVAYGRPGSARPGGVSRRAGLARAGIAVGILLAPSLLGGTEVFLENPDHAGTAVPILAMLLVLDRFDGRARTRWFPLAAVCALLALAEVGDELTLAAATVPVAVVSVIRLLTRAASGPGDVPIPPAGPVSPVPAPALGVVSADGGGRGAGARTDLLLLAATAASAGIAAVAGLALRSLGGFTQPPIPGGLLAPLGQVPGHARVLGPALALIFGANNPGVPLRPITRSWHAELVAMADLHVIGVALAAAGLIAGLAALTARRADRVTQVLVVGTLTVLAAGLLGTLLRSLSAAHEVAVLAPFGAVLAGRTLPPLLTARIRHWRWGVPMAGLALCGWLVIGVAELCFGAAWPSAPSPQDPLAAWLVAHRQADGLAGYWQANVITVATGGRVLVAPVQATGPRGLAPQHWEASADWYLPARHRATFVIAAAGPGQRGLSPAAVRTRFGPPAARYRVGDDIIMAYRYNLLTRLAAPGPA